MQTLLIHELAPPVVGFNSELFSICDNIQKVGVIMDTMVFLLLLAKYFPLSNF